jgi:hypothetical protein
MKWLLERAIPAMKIFQIAASYDEFAEWLRDEHGKEITGKIFMGYKYFLECTFSTIFDTIACEDSIGIKDDFLFKRASGNIVYIEKLPDSCEKVVLLKNINRFYKPLSESKTAEELKIALIPFQGEVIKRLEKIYSACYSVKNQFRFSKDLATKLLLIENLYLLFHQMANNGPVAHESTLLKEWWPPKSKRDTYLNGYKFTIQFVWYKVLGEKKYRNSSLKNIHQSDSWKDFVYNTPPVENPDSEQDYFNNLFNTTFDLDKQTNFGSYFYRIQREIIRPLEKRYRFFMNRSVEIFDIHKIKFPRTIFKSLLSTSDLIPVKVKPKDELDMLLYWYPVEIVNNETILMYTGIPSFITLLAGAVALLNNNESEFKKVMVCKFIHPTDKKNDYEYSYGVLIDSKAAIGHYSIGWMMFYDCFGNYSGFSKREHENAEKIIKKYEEKGLLDLVSKEVDKNVFRHYLEEYISEQNDFRKEIDLSDLNIIYVPDKNDVELAEKLDSIRNQQKKNFISDAKGIILELMGYYIASKHKKYEKYSDKEWSIESGCGEMDIIMNNDQEALLIECKLNVNTSDAHSIISKAKNKLKHKFPDKKHTIEIWSWAPIKTQNQAIFKNNDCVCYSLSADQNSEFAKYLKSRISSILNYEEKN